MSDAFFVITGALGADKTTLLESVKRMGYFVVEEPARLILAQQRVIGGRGVGEKDSGLVIELMLSALYSISSQLRQKVS